MCVNLAGMCFGAQTCIQTFLFWADFVDFWAVNMVNIRAVNGYRVEATFVQITFEIFLLCVV